MVENIFRHLVAEPGERFDLGRCCMRCGTQIRRLRGKFATIANSATEVNRAIFFSAAIIIAGFLPLFTLSGVEGHIFGPMAKTYAYAIAGGLIATFTVAPALSALLLPATSRGDRDPARAGAAPGLRPGAGASPWPTASLTLGGCAALLVVGAVLAVHGLGLEFLPKLEEGNLWIRATHAAVDLAGGGARLCQPHAPDHQGLSRRSQTVISQHGRPDDGTDATGFFNAEFFVPLKPADTWPDGHRQGEADRQ